MPKIPLDEGTKLLFYAAAEIPTGKIHVIAWRHHGTKKEGGLEISQERKRIDIYFPSMPAMGLEPKKEESDDSIREEAKKSLRGLDGMLKMMDTGKMKLEILHEEDLEHEDFNEMMNWLTGKPDFMKCICD